MQGQPTVIRTPVLVVGAGPSGLAASLLLKRYGIEALTISRYGWTAHTPRAHHVNMRAMEFLRRLDLEEAVTKAAWPKDTLKNVVWCVDMAGEELGRNRTYHDHGVGDYRDHTPCESINIPQNHLEPVLAEELLTRGGKLLWNTDCIAIDQRDDGATVTARSRVTGETFRIEADYVIGADGANSLIARTLELPFAGASNLGSAVNVWFRGDLSAYCRDRPGAVYWTMLPRRMARISSGTLIGVRPWNEWIIIIEHDPAAGPFDDDHESLKAHIRDIVGDDALEIDILNVGRWQIHATFATVYQKERVFCMGDAVHRHSPANGAGANTSMLDADNLIWKLKLVMDGRADAKLLDTYSQERVPVGQRVIERTIQTAGEVPVLLDAVGFKPGQSVEDAERAIATLREPGADGDAKRDQLAEAIRLQHYQFCLPGFEMGIRYVSPAIVKDEHPPLTIEDPDMNYVPQTTSGGVLPHAWLADEHGRPQSTLDLLNDGRFHLITGIGGDGWNDAADAVGRELGVEITVDTIGFGQKVTDPYNDWRRLKGTDDAGCLLVRPDAFIAWRSEHIPQNPTAALRATMRQILCLEGD